jgi:hypothetical protein
MKTPDEWAADMMRLPCPLDLEVVEKIFQEAMKTTVKDIAEFVEEEYNDDGGIAQGIRSRAAEILGEDDFCLD